MTEQSRTDSPSRPSPWHLMIAPAAWVCIACDALIANLKSEETRAFAVICPLLVLALLTLLDSDATREDEADRDPKPLHLTSLLFGIGLGVVMSLLREHGNIAGVHLEAILGVLVILPVHLLLLCLACSRWTSFALATALSVHGLVMGIIYRHFAYGGYYLDDIVGIMAIFSVVALVVGGLIKRISRKKSWRILRAKWPAAWAILTLMGMLGWYLVAR